MKIDLNKINEIVESIYLNKGNVTIWEGITAEEHQAVIEELKRRGWEIDETKR
mgnify:FL=1